MLDGRKIESQVHLLVDLLAFVNVGPQIGERRLHLRASELQERLRPQEVSFGFQSQIGERLVIGAPHFSVDLQEACNEIARSSGIDLAVYLFQKGIIDRQIPRAKLLGKYLEPEASRRFRPGTVPGKNHRR